MRVAVVGFELLGESRIRQAIQRLGGTVVAAGSSGPVDVAIVDLEAPGETPAPDAPRVIGIYPHVRADVAERARAAGMETYPRGRFFRELDDILSAGAGKPPR